MMTTNDDHKDYEKRTPDSQPEKINNKDVDFTPPAHEIKGESKTPLKQSELGREQGQTPASEEQNITQIDKGTVKIQNQKLVDEEKMLEGNDERDPDLDSSKDWDAEKNRSGRHK